MDGTESVREQLAFQRQNADEPAVRGYFYRRDRAAVMTLTPSVRKFVLTAHLTFSIGWIGAVVAYLALGVSSVLSQAALTARSAWVAMESPS